MNRSISLSIDSLPLEAEPSSLRPSQDSLAFLLAGTSILHWYRPCIGFATLSKAIENERQDSDSFTLSVV
jgi:hypothetical protein